MLLVDLGTSWNIVDLTYYKRWRPLRGEMKVGRNMQKQVLAKRT